MPLLDSRQTLLRQSATAHPAFGEELAEDVLTCLVTGSCEGEGEEDLLLEVRPSLSPLQVREGKGSLWPLPAVP